MHSTSEREHCEHCPVPGRPCLLRARGQCHHAAREAGVRARRPGAETPYTDRARRHAAAPGPARRLVIRSYLYDHGGYGRNGRMLGQAVEALGVPVAYWPIVVDESHLPLHPWLRDRLVDDPPEGWALLLSNPRDPSLIGDRRSYAHYSMFESTRMPEGSVENLNRAAGVLVPSTWVGEAFAAEGVSRPIRLVPHGVESDVFRPARRRPRRPFTVGLAGRTCHGGTRKGIAEAFEAFRLAFPISRFPDVRMTFKGFGDCPDYAEAAGGDPRIALDLRAYPEAEWPRWYHGIDAYLSMSKGEGFGLHGIESLASGVPMLGARWGGQADYLDESVGYEVDYRLGPASGDYEGLGEWSIPSVESAARRLREAHDDPAGRRLRGRAARRRALRFSWERAGRMLLDALAGLGALELPAAPTARPGRPSAREALRALREARDCRHGERGRDGCSKVRCTIHGVVPASRCLGCPDAAPGALHSIRPSSSR